jgi:hypothetical protein
MISTTDTVHRIHSTAKGQPTMTDERKIKADGLTWADLDALTWEEADGLVWETLGTGRVVASQYHVPLPAASQAYTPAPAASQAYTPAPAASQAHMPRPAAGQYF